MIKLIRIYLLIYGFNNNSTVQDATPNLYSTQQ